MSHHNADARAELKRVLIGNEVVDILPGNVCERICIIQYRTPGGQVESIQIGATELGWWVEHPSIGEAMVQEEAEFEKSLADLEPPDPAWFERGGIYWEEPEYSFSTYTEHNKKTGCLKSQSFRLLDDSEEEKKTFFNGVLEATYNNEGFLVTVLVKGPVPISRLVEVTSKQEELDFLTSSLALGFVSSG